jgi:uncharacterized protein YbcV (DUF1398 family)
MTQQIKEARQQRTHQRLGPILIELTRHATHIYSQYVLDTTFHRHLRTEYLSLN